MVAGFVSVLMLVTSVSVAWDCRENIRVWLGLDN